MWQLGMPDSMSIRRSLPLLVAVATCGAQPRHLATDHSGSVLHFTASMTSHGDAQTGVSRIFRWDAASAEPCSGCCRSEAIHARLVPVTWLL